jgi:hypothetical protein
VNFSGRHSLISHPLNEAEMTQIACRIVEAYGGQINFFRLVKLLYIVEHESWKQLSQPAMGGEYFSLGEGPMISETADATKPEFAENFKIWTQHLEKVKFGNGNGSAIKIIKPAGRDEISDALLAIVDNVIIKTKNWKNDPTLKNYVHALKEYKKPAAGGRLPIQAEEILEGVGKSPEKIKKIQSESEEWRKFEAALA